MPARRADGYLLTALTLTFGTVEFAAAQGPGPLAVAVAPVVQREIPPALRLVGTVRPERAAVVAAEVSGLVAAVEVQEGQFVHTGDVICRIDAEVASLRLEEARATLAALQAQLLEYENGERPEELRRLEALVAQAEAVYRKAEFERNRVAELAARGQGSDKEKHDAEMDCRAAAASLAQAQAQLERARNGERPEVLARARQAVAGQQAVVRRLEHDLAKTVVRAPFDGAVVAKRTEVGEWIAAGGPVCELIGLETVKVRVDVPERVVGFARPGAPASIEVEALGISRAAPIARVIPQATPAARTFPIEIDLPNPDHRLLSGMFVWAYVPAGPLTARLMVSKDAVVARGQSKQIFVVRSGTDGHHMAVPMGVTTGLEMAGEIEVSAEGLHAGELVVTRGNERLFGPTPVIPLPLNAAATQPTPATESGAAVR